MPQLPLLRTQDPITFKLFALPTTTRRDDLFTWCRDYDFLASDLHSVCALERTKITNKAAQDAFISSFVS